MEVPEEAVARPRRRGRTALLITGAAVLGLVAGTCAGYLVQADRDPTRLPSLSQPKIEQTRGEAPEPLSASRDRQVRTEGDLRELLLKKPAGAKKADWLGTDGWMTMADYAGYYDDPGRAFEDLSYAFRRAAVTVWEQDSYTVEIRLVQYRQDEVAHAASDSVEDAHYWAEATDSYEGDRKTRSWTVPGTEDGMAYVHTVPEREPGYLPVYNAEAHAWRGDIAMEIWVYGTEPIDGKTIRGLAERQMERL
ncbi:hypothetical protein [Streptomyces sp. NPDC000983]|uniref:hypothetical protein n=1 Tax=Streptomyces sp. NPDC000983 TaxID=3154373 RepID=UPI0033230670